MDWSGPRGGEIGVGFDDAYLNPRQMEIEINHVGRAYPDLPDELPPGTRFSFGKDGTGHLAARFRVGGTVYRSGGQEGELHGLWDVVGLIDGLLHPERLEAAP